MRYFQSVAIAIAAVNLFSMGFADNVCVKEYRYVELEQVKTTQPVQVRSYNWCLSYPPRCTNYHTEIKEVVKFQNVTKATMIEYCCPGFVEVKDTPPPSNETIVPEVSAHLNRTGNMICRPLCRGGCGKGICQAPNSCKCDVGYEGRHCSQRCRYGMWGFSCKNHCKCRNGSLCDNKSGFCRCTEGWIGENCETPCPTGQHGIMCKSVCECASRMCNHINGECLYDDSHIIFDWDGSSGRNTSTIKVPIDRIKAKHWIQIEGNGRMAMENCSSNTSISCDWNNQDMVKLNSTNKVAVGRDIDGNDDGIDNITSTTNNSHDPVMMENLIATHGQSENNTVIMNALRLSITNLTENIGKLSKQVSDQRLALEQNEQQKLNSSDNHLSGSVSEIDTLPEAALISIINDKKVTIDSDKMDTNGQAIVQINTDLLANLKNLNQTEDASIVELVTIESNIDVEPIPSQTKLAAIIEQTDAINEQASDNSADAKNGHLQLITRLRGLVPTVIHSNPNTTTESGPEYATPIVLILTLIILIIFGLITLAYVYQRQNEQNFTKQMQSTNVLSEPELIAVSRIEQKPLPGIPTFIPTDGASQCQVNLNNIASNNTAVGAADILYNYGKLDFPKRRRSSTDDHIYDEIIYPPALDHQKIVTSNQINTESHHL